MNSQGQSIPTGTVTFLFTDIEGSTKLAQAHPDTWDRLQGRHHAILRSTIESYNGTVFQTIGDAFCAAFHTASDGLNAAIKAQHLLQQADWGETPIRVRMGLHTGSADFNGTDYHGYLTLVKVQRIMSVAYGGQVLLSTASAELVRGELPEGVSLLDMQEHRFKGLLNPERIWQIVAPNLPKDFPPLRSLNDIPNNLPLQLTSFIGREKEIVEIKQALETHHLVTLTGAGGSGKSRLSLHVAAEIIDSFPDGVWFVELAPITDPALVPATLANLLELRDSAESKQPISEVICGYFRARKALVIFDNCEHLLESCAQIIDLLLRSCRDVHILASSRETLGVEGELAWQVLSLSSPDSNHPPALEQLSQYEAVRLFIDRAKLVQPRFEVTNYNAPAVAQICSHLDGIPLAIELAAARIHVLTADQIAKRLNDRFHLLTGGVRTALPRQQTLRAMIDWSFDLLTKQEQLLLIRLAVFVGGWTLEAAEAVCSGEEIGPDLILDLLAQLVKKSLVLMTEKDGESRYYWLETVQQYAREKLIETKEVVLLRNRHLDYFIQLAEQGYEQLHGPNDLIWIERLDTEHDNLRAALSWSLESPESDPQKALQLSSALKDFWDMRGHSREGYQWLQRSLAKASEDASKYRCRALHGAGLLCMRLTLYKETVAYMKASLSMARMLNIPSLIVPNLLDLSDRVDDIEEGRAYFDEAIALARATEDRYFLTQALVSWPVLFQESLQESICHLKEAHKIVMKLGNAGLREYVLQIYGRMEMIGGHYQSSEAMLREALRLNQLLKDKHSTAHCLHILGRAATQQAQYEKAVRYEEQSLQIFQDLSDPGCLTLPILHLGWNAYLAGKPEVALEYLEKSLSRSYEFNFKAIRITSLTNLGYITAARWNLPTAKDRFLEAFELLKVQESSYQLAHALEMVCILPGLDVETVTQLLGKALAIREQNGFVLPVSEQQLVHPIIENVQSRLEEDAFNSVCAAGAGLTYQQTIDKAINALQSII